MLLKSGDTDILSGCRDSRRATAAEEQEFCCQSYVWKLYFMQHVHPSIRYILSRQKSTRPVPKANRPPVPPRVAYKARSGPELGV